MYTNIKDTKFVPSNRVIYISYILRKKTAKHVLLFISKGILDMIALYFIILAPESKRAFGKANFRV